MQSGIHRRSGVELFRESGVVAFTQVQTRYPGPNGPAAATAASPDLMEGPQGTPLPPALRWRSGVGPGALTASRLAPPVPAAAPAYAFLCRDGLALVLHLREKWERIDILKESRHTACVNGIVAWVAATTCLVANASATGALAGALGGLGAAHGTLVTLPALIMAAVAGGLGGAWKGFVAGGSWAIALGAGVSWTYICYGRQRDALALARRLDEIVAWTILTVRDVASGERSFDDGLAAIGDLRRTARDLHGGREPAAPTVVFAALDEARDALTDQACREALFAGAPLPPRPR